MYGQSQQYAAPLNPYGQNVNAGYGQQQQQQPSLYGVGAQQPQQQMAAVQHADRHVEGMGVKLTPAGSGGREVQDHDKYSFDVLKDKMKDKEMDFDTQIPAWYYQSMVALQAYFLFNGIITLMALAQNYGVKKQVNPTLIAVAAYSPIAFFFLYIILFNNYFSEQVYYLYIKYGAVVDFPESASMGEWFKNLMPLTFILSFSAYIIFMFFYYATTGATVAEIWVFMSNAFIGVFLFWYRHQSIESKFISLSDYIQAFPDGRGMRHNMDAVSCDKAARTLNDCVLLETTNMCYSGYMREWWWGQEKENLGMCARLIHYTLLLGMVGVAMGGAVFMLKTPEQVKMLDWDLSIKPCVEVCLDYAANCTQCLTSCRNITNNMDNNVCVGLKNPSWSTLCKPWCT